MKIGICTCYDNHNYGSMLQAYATYVKFVELGYDCEFLCYRKKLNTIQKIKWLPRLLNKYLMKEKFRLIEKKIQLKKHPDIKMKDAIRQRAFDRFLENFLKDKVSAPYIGFEALRAGSKNYDVVVAGGDQLWIPAGLPTNFFNLMFADEKVKRVSYSTSFGVTEVPFYQKRRTIEYLNRIEMLGVREKSGAELIERLTGRKAVVVLDPTLLLNKEECAQAIPVKPVLENDYIFCYFLGANSEHRKVAEELSKKTGIPLYDMPHIDEFVPYDLQFNAEHLYDIDSEQFVNLIRYAKYICTDSFHCTVFSILHHKQFLAFDRYSDPLMMSRNSRIANLCDITGLSSRRYTGDVLEQMKKPIDYDRVDERLEKEKAISVAYIREALGKND